MMIRIHLQFIFFISSVVLQSLSWGNDNPVIKPDEFLFPTSSCVDRCHVNYMAYHTIYQGEVFRHKTHSPNQELACCQCHNNDAVNTKTHGGLIIQNKDCWNCHHRSDETTRRLLSTNNNENPPKFSLSPLGKEEKVGFTKGKNCLNCHADVKDYINGDIQNIVAKIPDWMSKAVSCTDCHKVELNKPSFKTVRAYCIECHNNDYGLLYDAWKETLDREIKRGCGNTTNTITINRQNHLKPILSHAMHNFRLSQILLDQLKND